MSFHGDVFTYNGTGSDYYGLRISNIDSESISRMMSSYSVDIIEKKLIRRPNPFFFGVDNVPHLEFDVSAFSEDGLSAQDYELVQMWLFGQRVYRRFQIVQDDMQSTCFDVIPNSPQVVKIGNLIKGVDFRVVCNGPFGYRPAQTITNIYSGTPTNTSEVFYNASQDTSNYLFPTSVITMNSTGGNMSIVNASDGNRAFTFTGLSANEVVTVNSSLGIITSSTGLKRLSTFNKHWLRFVPGANNLTVTGNVASIAHTFILVVKSI
jgi:phage-related protein